MELVQHYSSEKFGVPNIGPSNEGVRILDLIRSLMAGPSGYPLAPAADEVLGKLEALGDGLELYLADTDSSGWAQPWPLSRLETVVTGTRTIDPFLDASLHHHQANVQGRDYGRSWEEFMPRQPRKVNETAAVQTPWLETLRCELVKKGNRKALESPDLVRLVMRRDLANELFGCGPVLSFWEEQPQPVPVNGPGNYPPPELQGIRAHDAKVWGALLTSESPPRAVVRIADLVQYVADRKGVPAVRDIAAQVLEAIGAGAPGLYLLNQGSMAAPLDPAHLWRHAFVSGAEHQAESRRQIQSMPGLVNLWPVKPDEADARGLPADDGTRTKCGHAPFDPDWPALPELAGPAGALQLARLQWVERARRFADLDAGDLGRLAVPLAWVVAKFGKPVPPVEQLAPLLVERPADLAAIPTADDEQTRHADQPADDGRVVQPEGSSWPRKPGRWSKAEKAAVQAMRDNGMTGDEIAKRVGVSRQSMDEACGAAKPKPGASVFRVIAAAPSAPKTTARR